jgi:hypothetical protein
MSVSAQLKIGKQVSKEVPMRSIKSKLLCSVLTVCLLLIPLVTQVLAQDPVAVQEKTSEGMAFDLVVLRPLGIVSTALGSVVHVVGLIFSGPGGNAGESAQLLITEPAKFTFARPLGDF